MSDDKHTGLRGAMDRAADIAGGIAGSMAAATTGAASRNAFVEKASASNLYEIRAARLALTRGKSPKVRDLAQTMLDDHKKTGETLEATLKKVTDPPQPVSDLDSRHAQMLDHLEKTPDEDFDSRYVEQQDLAHTEAITLFKGYARAGDDPVLRQFAEATLPDLQHHKEMVSALR